MKSKLMKKMTMSYSVLCVRNISLNKRSIV